MHPDKVNRNQLKKFTDLPNIGPAGAKDYQLLGYTEPQQLVGVCAFHLYQQLCQITGQQQDPCVLDVLLSVERFLAGDAPKAWWAYTAERQKILGSQV